MNLGLAPTSPSAAGDAIPLSVGDVRVPLYPAGGSPTAGATHADQPYPSPEGSEPLREAIATEAMGDSRSAGGVVVTPGARVALWMALAADARGGGRRVALFSPCWPSYAPLCRMAGWEASTFSTPVGTDDWLDEQLLSRVAAVEPGAIIVNSPRNPDGAVLSAEAIARLVDWSTSRDVTVIFDEVYRRVPTTGEQPVVGAAEALGELPPNCVIIDGLSKSHGVSGLRLGWAISSGDRRQQLRSAASHALAGTSRAAQEMGLSVLAAANGFGERLSAAVAENQAFALEALAAVPGVACDPPRGGIFLFPRVDVKDAQVSEVVERLRREHGVSVTDGAAFGAPDHVRLNFMLPRTDLEEGIVRFARGLATYGG